MTRDKPRPSSRGPRLHHSLRTTANSRRPPLSLSSSSGVETRTIGAVAAAHRTRTGSASEQQPRRIRAHHFPLYSHPMFRAAIQNSDAVRAAIDAQVEQVDPEILNSRLEEMVEELLQQQQEEKGAAGAMANGNEPAMAISEDQLLALIEAASHTSGGQRRESNTVARASRNTKSTTAVVFPQGPGGAVSSGALPARSLPPSTRHVSGADAPAQQRTKRGSSDISSNTENSGVHVVSVNTLKKAAVAAGAPSSRTGTADGGGGAAVELERTPSSLVNTPYALKVPAPGASTAGDTTTTSEPPHSNTSPVDHSLHHHSPERALALNAFNDGGNLGTMKRPTTLFEAAPLTTAPAPSRKAPTATASLYSLLPPTTDMAPAGTKRGGAAAHTTNTAGSSTPSTPITPLPGLTFADMDRRPGITTGPIAQQAVDSHQLRNVSDAAFAAMDVLMDGNSTCIRHRPRGRDTPFTRHHNNSNSNSSGPGRKAGSPPRSFVPTTRCLTLPPPPPPRRNDAEVKARRILDAQRRRQRSSERSFNTAPSTSTAMNESSVNAAAGRYSDLTSSLPSRTWGHRVPHGTSSKPAATTTTTAAGGNGGGGLDGAAPPVQREGDSVLPPLATMRDLSSATAYTQAVNSAHHFTTRH